MSISRNVTGIALFGTFVAAAPPTFAQQAEECQSVSSPLAGTVTDANNFASESQIQSGLLAGTASFAGDAQSLIQVSGIEAAPAVEPNFALTNTFDVATEIGTLNTVGVGALEAVPGGLASYYHRITGGDGNFEGAVGFLFTSFVLNQDASEFVGQVNGLVCMVQAGAPPTGEAPAGGDDAEGETPTGEEPTGAGPVEEGEVPGEDTTDDEGAGEDSEEESPVEEQG